MYQGKNKVAEFGEIHPLLAKKWKIKTNVVIGMVGDISALPKIVKSKKTTMSEFQPITRDFAFIVDADCAADKIVSAAKSVDPRIENITIFDAFDMGDDKKSIAFTILVIPTDNIGEDGMMIIQNKIIENVSKLTGGQIRDK